MTGKDKDYRYMATSDLLNELNKDSFKLDSDLEMRLSSIILQQLDDVSGLAVKWLAFFSLHLLVFSLSLSSISDSWCVSFCFQSCSIGEEGRRRACCGDDQQFM